MTDAQKITMARRLYVAGVCPGCGTDLEDVAGQGDGHTRYGKPFTGGHHPQTCDWSADDLAALVHIGSGLVKYDPSTDVSNRTSGGDDGSPRETAPTR